MLGNFKKHGTVLYQLLTSFMLLDLTRGDTPERSSDFLFSNIGQGAVDSKTKIVSAS